MKADKKRWEAATLDKMKRMNMPKVAKLFVAAVYVVCPRCNGLQPSQANGDHYEDQAWPLDQKVPIAYKVGYVVACATCGEDFKCPALPARVPVTPADQS